MYFLLYVKFDVSLKNVLKVEMLCVLHATGTSWWILMIFRVIRDISRSGACSTSSCLYLQNFSLALLTYKVKKYNKQCIC